MVSDKHESKTFPSDENVLSPTFPEPWGVISVIQTPPSIPAAPIELIIIKLSH